MGEFKKRDYIWPSESKYQNYPKELSDLEYIRHQIYHPRSNKNTHGKIVLENEKKPVGKNYYTEKELADAIKKMSEIFGASS